MITAFFISTLILAVFAIVGFLRGLDDHPLAVFLGGVDVVWFFCAAVICFKGVGTWTLPFVIWTGIALLRSFLSFVGAVSRSSLIDAILVLFQMAYYIWAIFLISHR